MGDAVDDVENNGCKKQCTRNSYTAKESKLATAGDENEDYYLWFLYSSAFIKESREYTLMDFPNIVSAIGGSLGLFLGFSCYGILWDAVDRLPWPKGKVHRGSKAQVSKYIK